MTQSLLPANRTTTEQAFEAAMARISDVPVPISTLWNPDLCPSELLPWLAWTFSVDDWDSTWPESTQRAVIAASFEVHRHKGTISALKRVLKSAGYGGSQIIERGGLKYYDGSLTFNGAESHSAADHWAEYRVKMERPVTFRQAARIRKILASVAPARCHLKVLDFTEAFNIYDSTVTYGGAYSYGTA